MCFDTINHFTDAEDTDASPQVEDESDDVDEADDADDEPDYENMDTVPHQTHDSDDSDNDYLNVDVCGQRSALVDNDHEGEGIYANCLE